MVLFVYRVNAERSVLLSRMRLSTKAEPRKDGVGSQRHHGALLTSHTEAAFVADAHFGTDALILSGTVGEDEIGHPALFAEIHVAHAVKSRPGVHDGITPFLVVYDEVDNPNPGVVVNGQILGAGEGSMEIEGYQLEIGALGYIFDGIGHPLAIQRIDGHIGAELLEAAVGHILLEAGESSFSTDTVVHGAYAIHAHPDAIGPGTGKRPLGVGGNGAGEEPQRAGHIAQVIDVLVAVVPKERFTTFEVDIAGTQTMTILELLSELLHGLGKGILVVVYTAVLATEVAAVADKDYTLERGLASQFGTEPPPGKVGHFFQFVHSRGKYRICCPRAFYYF